MSVQADAVNTVVTVEPASQVAISISPNTSKLLKQYATSGMATALATSCTHPIDTVKVRMQLAKREGGRSAGMLRTAVDMTKAEGPFALYKGVNSAVARATLYGAIRLGTYPVLKQAFGGDNADFSTRVAAGAASGVLAGALCNPTDLIKTRLQMKGSQHSTGGAVIRDIWKNEGFKGFWKGTTPSAVRAGVLTAAQCATYDEVKKVVMSSMGLGDTAATHFIAAMVAGLLTNTVMAPVDTIKTHMFTAARAASAASAGSATGGAVAAAAAPSGIFSTASAIVAREGVMGLMKGWTPNYMRLGPQTTISFMAMEALRKMAGLDSLGGSRSSSSSGGSSKKSGPDAKA